MAEHKLYGEVVQALLSDPRVTEANMFGMPALKVGGKAFALFYKVPDGETMDQGRILRVRQP